MIDSVRGRLALWHTSVLAALLVTFASLSYGMLSRTITRRTDAYLEESVAALSDDLHADEISDVSDSTSAQATLSEFHLRDLGFLVYDSKGRLVASDLPADSAAAGNRAGAMVDFAAVRASIAPLLVAAGPRFVTLPNAEGGMRMYAARTGASRNFLVVVAVASLADQTELLEEVRAGFIVAIIVGLVLAWGGGYALARRSLAPVVAMSERAADIGATSLHERLPVANPNDELGRLASTFNELLARLDTAFDQQRRFMADASHELRTPVAVMLGEADIALSQAHRPDAEYRSALQALRDEGRRLSRIVGDLFLLARADAGQRPLQRREFYLDELVSECVRAARALGAARGTTVRFDPPSPSIISDAASDPEDDWPIEADEELIRSLVMNLLDNAIKHSPAGATVTIALHRDAWAYRITVSDTGPGIPEDARAHVFERFYRVDAARGREATSESGGAGLGLAIGRWIAESHGGTLDLVETTSAGSCFEVVLPRAGARAWHDQPFMSGHG
ncbi:MAG: sensor histidine kinase [Gemmatimonadaceae bacterium]